MLANLNNFLDKSIFYTVSYKKNKKTIVTMSGCEVCTDFDDNTLIFNNQVARLVVLPQVDKITITKDKATIDIANNGTYIITYDY